MFHNNKKMFIAGAVLAVAVIGLVFNVAFKTGATSVKPSEYKKKSKIIQEGTPIKLVGKVAKKSVGKSNGKLIFKVKDDKAKEDSEKISVIYEGAMPSGFAEGRYVIVDGAYSKGEPFVATYVTTKCPSKYQEKNKGKGKNDDKGKNKK